jgi:hypothetical protein
MSLYGPLAKLEEERRLRRLAELDKKFKTTIQHMAAVEKVNEDAYKAKRAVLEEASKHLPAPKPAPRPPARLPAKAHKPLTRKGKK